MPSFQGHEKLDYSEWEPVYLEIVKDFGFDVDEDEISVRMLKALTLNSDLVFEDVLADLIGNRVTVFGDANRLEDDIEKMIPKGTFISAGSATERVMDAGIVPDIVVTDLDGNINCQMKAGNSGAITIVLAHGDNVNNIARYITGFKGPLILTTQGRPSGTVVNYGGFTDGDRAVCTARHFGAKEIILEGFDFDEPRLREGDVLERSLKKLKWAEKIIFGMNPSDVSIIRP